MEKVLVTGATGFIGSHTCLVLLQQGYEVYALDSCINSSSIALERVINILKKDFPLIKEKLHFFCGDIRDKNFLENIFNKSSMNGDPINSVIHFAGLKSVAESIKKPIEYWDVNLNGSINLVRVMNDNNCNNIVFSSSASVYKYKKTALNEKSKIEPFTTYGATKLAVEELLNRVFISEPNKWRIANLRYFNPIGAHPSGDIGEDPAGNPNNLFPYLTQVASGQRKVLKIYGRDWPTPDGTCLRDYIHVLDLAEGHLNALKYLNSQNPQVLNLNMGSGSGTSVLELVEIFQKINNIEIPFVFESRRIGDISSLVADSSLASSLINWKPKRSINEMCKDGWNWQSKNPKGYR